MSDSEPSRPPIVGPAGPISIPARLPELSPGDGVWLKGDDLAVGALPDICCLTGETPVVMRRYWFESPSQWRYQGWWDLGSFIGANLPHPNSGRIRTLLPVGDRAFRRRNLITRWLSIITSAALALLVLSVVLGLTLSTDLEGVSYLVALSGLIALVGAVPLFVLYVAGVGHPRGTAHSDASGHVHLLLANPHPNFAAAVRERYGPDYARLGPYSNASGNQTG